MIVGVVGSREGFTEREVHEQLRLLDVSLIISGGARGVDKFAESYAKDNELFIEIIRPIDPAQKMDYLFRNIEIITKSDFLIIFWDGKSRGTKFVMDYALKRSKPHKIIKHDASLVNSVPQKSVQNDEVKENG